MWGEEEEMVMMDLSELDYYIEQLRELLCSGKLANNSDEYHEKYFEWTALIFEREGIIQNVGSN